MNKKKFSTELFTIFSERDFFGNNNLELSGKKDQNFISAFFPKNNNKFELSGITKKLSTVFKNLNLENFLNF